MSELQNLKKNAGLNEDPQMMKIKVINSGYRTDMGMKDAMICLLYTSPSPRDRG